MLDIGWVPLIIVGFIGFGWFVIVLSVGQALVDWMMGWLKEKEGDDE